jgi:hypothetical protein
MNLPEFVFLFGGLVAGCKSILHVFIASQSIAVVLRASPCSRLPIAGAPVRPADTRLGFMACISGALMWIG